MDIQSSMFKGLEGLDERSVKFLVDALQKSNLPGFDYMEFKQSLENLSALGLDDIAAMRSAFATAKTVGLSKDKLLKTAAHYRDVLNKEKAQFDAAVQKQIENKVRAKQAEVERLHKQMEDYKAKIRDLENKMAAAQQTINDADSMAQDAMQKIESTKNGFDATLKVLMQEIEEDIQNIQQYL
jgi:chromosome segregation ATPase